MKYVYDELSKIENLADKLELNESQDFISISFNEYLYLGVSDDMIEVNVGLSHWHPFDDNDIIQKITQIANGELIFIERKNFFFLLCDNPLRILEKKKFEKKKKKYLSKKHLRIYTGNVILKRNTI